jgi:hypothetical protein
MNRSDIRYNLAILRSIIPNISVYYQQINVKKSPQFNKMIFTEICKHPNMEEKYADNLLNIFSHKLERDLSFEDRTFNIIDVHAKYIIRHFKRKPTSKQTFDRLIKKSIDLYWGNFENNFHRKANAILAPMNF